MAIILNAFTRKLAPLDSKRFTSVYVYLGLLCILDSVSPFMLLMWFLERLELVISGYSGLHNSAEIGERVSKRKSPLSSYIPTKERFHIEYSSSTSKPHT